MEIHELVVGPLKTNCYIVTSDMNHAVIIDPGFDAEKIIDKATYNDCNAGCEGLSFVIVDGKIVVKDAVFNGTLAGKILLK